MKRLVCPHCNSHRILAARIPKDVVVVMPCPACSELVVMFRRKVMGLDRTILERGSREERKMHIAEVIADFLEPGFLKLQLPNQAFELEARADDSGLFIAGDDQDKGWLPPITEREQRQFTKFQLSRLDNGEYFKKHLG